MIPISRYESENRIHGQCNPPTMFFLTTIRARFTAIRCGIASINTAYVDHNSLVSLQLLQEAKLWPSLLVFFVSHQKPLNPHVIDRFFQELEHFELPEMCRSSSKPKNNQGLGLHGEMLRSRSTVAGASRSRRLKALKQCSLLLLLSRLVSLV